MPAVQETNLSGNTVEYNGVQFGGGDSLYTMMPPMIFINSQAVYDESKRAVKFHRHTITVKTIIFEGSLSGQESQMETIRDKLCQPQKELKLTGLGFTTNSTAIKDMENGPLPDLEQWQPVGANLAWSLIWTCRFSTNKCFDDLSDGDNTSLESLNYSQVFSFDEEGITTRTITGVATVPRWTSAPVGMAIADLIRDRWTVLVPFGFTRKNQSFNLSNDAKEIRFSIVDRELPGHVYPTSITKAKGNLVFDADGPGFGQAVAAMQMTLTTAPNAHRSVAAVHFFLQMASVQQRWVNYLNLLNKEGAVIPHRIVVQQGMYDDARTTTFGCQWMIAGCCRDLLLSAELWDVLPNGDYILWASSVQEMFGSRGWAHLVPDADEQNRQVTICEPENYPAIGATTRDGYPAPLNSIYDIVCPTITEDNSWLAYDARVTTLKSEDVKVHRKAVERQTPTQETNNEDDPAEPFPIGPDYDYGTPSEYHSAEYRGQPRTQVAVQFIGMRLKFAPKAPVLKSFQGAAVTALPHLTETEGPRVIADIAGCPVYLVKQVTVYEVEGPVDKIKPHKQKVLCGLGNIDAEEDL